MMRKPSLSADTFAAALALLAAGASAGCSKADTAAKADPAAASAPPKQWPVASAAPPSPPVAATPAASVAGDGGLQKNSGASCGAGTCSADMKKGK